MAAATVGIAGALAAAGAIGSAAIQSGAAGRGAQTSADAILQGSQMQLAELQRQFDYQMELMAPFLERQNQAGAAFAQLMGFGGPGVPGGALPRPPPPGGGQATAQPALPPGQAPGAGFTGAIQPTPPAPGMGGGPTVGPDGRVVYDPNQLGRGGMLGGYGPQPTNQIGQAGATPAGPAIGSSVSGLTAAPGDPQPGRAAAVMPSADLQMGPDGVYRVDPNVIGAAPTNQVPPGVGVAQGPGGPPPPGRGTGVRPGADARAQATFDQRFQHGRAGGFVDPNLNPAQLGAESALGTEYGQHAFTNVLAGRRPQDDLAIQRARETALYGGVGADTLVQRVRENQLAAGTLAGDERFQFARGTEVVGPTFEESPGFRFQMEEAQRELERRQSRGGGGYGGRAVLEAQRRSQGLAQQDYYNYVGARQRDLARQDMAAAAHQQRQAVDIGRGDQAVMDARRREELDLRRGDVALASYFDRRAGDLSRQDAAILNNQRLRQYDLQRQDQGYYNYLANLASAAGFGNFTGQAVGAAGAQGAQAANVYGQQAGSLASIYGQQAAAQGAAGANLFGNLNQIGQGTIQNWLFQQGLNPATGRAPAVMPPSGGYDPNFGVIA